MKRVRETETARNGDGKRGGWRWGKEKEGIKESGTEGDREEIRAVDGGRGKEVRGINEGGKGGKGVRKRKVKRERKIEKRKGVKGERGGTGIWESRRRRKGR